MIGNKIANKITRLSKNKQQNNSETVTNEHDKEIQISQLALEHKKSIKINDESQGMYNKDNQN